MKFGFLPSAPTTKYINPLNLINLAVQCLLLKLIPLSLKGVPIGRGISEPAIQTLEILSPPQRRGPAPLKKEHFSMEKFSLKSQKDKSPLSRGVPAGGGVWNRG